MEMKTQTTTGGFKEVCLSGVANGNGNKVAAVTGGNVPPSLPSGSLGTLRIFRVALKSFPTSTCVSCSHRRFSS